MVTKISALPATQTIGWVGRGIVSTPAAGSVQLGAADADTNAALVAQVLRTQGALTGGTANQAGKNFTFIVSPGKGTGAGGSFILQTVPAGASSSTTGTPVTALTIDSTGLATFAAAMVVGGALTPAIDNTYELGSTSFKWAAVRATNFFASSSLRVLSDTGLFGLGSTTDTFLTRPSAASWQLGAVDVDTNAAIVAQTLRTQGALTGGTTNQAGKDFTLIVSPGKGTGAGGSFILQTAPAGGSGSTPNAPVTVLTVNSAGAATLLGSLTYTTATSGPILKQGANGRCGTFTADGVTPVSISNTSVAITDCIIISLNTVGGTVGVQPHVATITAGVGFDVVCTATDTSTYNYAIIKNAA